MAETRSSGSSNILCISVFTVVLWSNILTSAEEFTADFSSLSLSTTKLDLSQKNISALQISDFSSLSKLQVLNLSHNLISELDLSIFQYNKDLLHLDLSHNKLRTLSCYGLVNLRHLDLSYNNYPSIPKCPEFVNMSKLDYLAFSARRIQSSDFSVLTHLRLERLFLGLEDLSDYRPQRLPVFSTKHLELALPHNAEIPVVCDLELSTTESLALSNVRGKQVDDLSLFLSNLNKRGRLLNLTLNNIKLTWGDLTSIFRIVWKSTIEYFNIKNIILSEIKPETLTLSLTSLKALTIEHGIVETLYFNQSHVYRILSDMNIAALTVNDMRMLHMLCPTKRSVFTYLSFSNNMLTDSVFEGCDHLTLLESLILQNNRFTSLTKVSSMTSQMKSLKYLDMSQNALKYEEIGATCPWAEELIKLNLSFNFLDDAVFRCLPVNIQRLDLQNNHISSVPKEMVELKTLEELNLASNKLSDLPGCGQLGSLQFLNVEANSILSPSSEFFQSCRNLKRLKGGHNPLLCSCELRQLINLEKQGLMTLLDWPDSYVCSYPEDLRGTLLADFHVHEVSCNATLLVVIILIVAMALVAIISFLCIRLDIPWYLKMMWQWGQVKHRGWSSNPEEVFRHVQFHAFISYSEQDSDWVKNVLIPNLEKEDGSIQICQHERNFIAGKTIVENIIDCIEKSYKSIFVLSPNFVQSEWCHYELYFAHHKLFSEKGDRLILLLLDSIPVHIIPARYHKLKALMAKRTYLEWPNDKSKNGLFWANLRAAIHMKLPNRDEINTW